MEIAFWLLAPKMDCARDFFVIPHIWVYACVLCLYEVELTYREWFTQAESFDSTEMLETIYTPEESLSFTLSSLPIPISPHFFEPFYIPLSLVCRLFRHPCRRRMDRRRHGERTEAKKQIRNPFAQMCIHNTAHIRQCMRNWLNASVLLGWKRYWNAVTIQPENRWAIPF